MPPPTPGRGGRGGGFRGGKQVYKPAGGVPKLDARVLDLENEFDSSLSLKSLSLTEQAFPQRPSFGTQGTKVLVWANFVELLVDPKLVLHTYRLEVEPKAAGKKLARILKLFVAGPQCTQLKGKIATDFVSTMVSLENLPDSSFNIRYRADGEDEPDAKATIYHVRVRHTTKLPVAALLKYLDPTQPAADFDKATTIQAFNIVLNHFTKTTEGLLTIGSKVFPLGTNKSITDLGNGLQAMRGFYGSVRAATGRILVNVNICFGVFFQPGPLHVLLGLLARGGQDKYQLERALRGLTVKVMHLFKTNSSGGEIPRLKKISGFATVKDGTGPPQKRPRIPEFGAGPKQVHFWLENKHMTGYITVYEFFRLQHKILLKHVDLPVINVGSKHRPVYLPPELCEVEIGQRASRIKLDASQSIRMLAAAVRRPFENAPTIVNIGLQAVGLGPQNELLKSFCMNAKPSLITAAARVLPEPRVYYSKKPAKLNQSRAWNVLGQTFTIPATITRWGWLLIGIPGNEPWCGFSGDPEVVNTLRAFHRVMTSMGIQIGAPQKGKRLQLRGLDDPALDKELEVLAGALDFLLVILPGKTPVYDRIKHQCDVKFGLINVCCIGQLLKKNDDQYFRNVALKINAKCDGHNQVIESSRLHLIAQGKTMVVGIDVTHPSPGNSETAPSIAAMVANPDGRLGQFSSVLKVQSKSRQEMVSGLKDMLKHQLYRWKTKGKHVYFPENIIVYRDGVSEGQYQLVKKTELPLLREACDEVYQAANQAKPRITIVIVTKRHHKRFYPTAEATADNGSNCMAGTIVDRGVTEARNWDFYIMPHTALKGTARPTYYFVVHDEIFHTSHRGTKLGPADTLEDVTQSLSYISARSTKPVSVCAPADYADLACERARCYLRHLFDPSARSESGISQLSGVEAERHLEQLQEEINLHEKTRDVMVYI